MIPFRHKHREMPQLNMASLPDLIFTVLFFFMIVTHMRQSSSLLQVNIPQGQELAQAQHKEAMVYIYIGKTVGDAESDYQIQVNNQLVKAEQLTEVLQSIREKMPQESQRYAMAMLRADKNTPMRLVKQLKTALRKAQISKIAYVATENKTED